MSSTQQPNMTDDELTSAAKVAIFGEALTMRPLIIRLVNELRERNAAEEAKPVRKPGRTSQTVMQRKAATAYSPVDPTVRASWTNPEEFNKGTKER